MISIDGLPAVAGAGCSRLRRVLRGLLATAALACCTPLASATLPPNATKPDQALDIDLSSGVLLKIPGPAATLFVADPAIADVQSPRPDRIFVFGKAPGQTSLFALGADGQVLAAYQLMVRSPQAALDTQIERIGGAGVHLQYTQHGVILSGQVPDLATARTLLQTARQTVGSGLEVADQLQITGPMQVNLRVRVAEVSRQISQQLGFNWSMAFGAGSAVVGLQTGRLAGGGGGSLLQSGLDGIFGSVHSHGANGVGVLDAMANEGLVTLLAEPNLIAESGSSANFLAGGEIPITVAQGLGTSSIIYKQYGVGIEFTPTVTSSSDISMKVRAEVSALDPNTTIELNSSQSIPALTTRRAETKVDLASGQSFAIAGLIRNDASNNIQKIPWLGDLPVLGSLFRSKNFQHDQTELVIVITAYVVKPTAASQALDDPLQTAGRSSRGEPLPIAEPVHTTGLAPPAPGAQR